MVDFKQVEYGGWQQCYALSNSIIELVITGQVGPRLIRFGFVGGQNEFCEVPESMGKTTGDDWRLYGGHRLWHAPEHKPRTYYPDNDPVEVTQHDGFIRVTQPTEPTTGLQKQMDIYMAAGAAHVRVVHRLVNTGLWPIYCAPWALSVMAAGSLAVLPLPPRGSHDTDLLPANTLTLWSYTDMSDARWTWGQRYILLRQDASAQKPQKVGVDVRDGWAASLREGNLFIKRFNKQASAIYPDMGCVVEAFTNHFMLELETLGPLENLAAGGSLQHTEHWFLFPDVPTPAHDADVEQHIIPHVRTKPCFPVKRAVLKGL